MANGTQTKSQRDSKAIAHQPDETPAVHGRAAADVANAGEQLAIDLPVLGEVRLPHPHDVAFYAGVGVLVALELLEWPAAIALAVGHALIGQQQHRRLKEFGEALEDV
jgi:hypothetical protein